MRGICLTLALVLTSTLVMARSYFLPDYQGAGLELRIQETDKQNNIITCSTYGLYNSIQSGMTCSVVYPTSGLACYTCSCDSVYKYSSADCPTPPYILSDQCKGKYKSCSCDTTLYPTTSATGGCPYGFIPDINNYCEDKPDATKHYACVKPVCKPDNITIEECQAKGAGYNCTASKETNCADYCDTNGCQDKCAYLKQTGQVPSYCRYGCATGKEVSGCSDLCYECGDDPRSLTNTCVDIYNGKSNSSAIVVSYSRVGLAAVAAKQYYVGSKFNTFGQGEWYLPAIGELVDMYGVDPDQITYGSGKSGATGENMKRINDTLTALYDKGVDTDILSDSYWSSSEHSADHAWTLTVSSANGSGNRSYTLKDYSDHTYVRPFVSVDLLGCDESPKVGQIMYIDKTWGNVRDYYSWRSEQPIGVIASNKIDCSIKVVSLKNLTFSSIDSRGNFDADNPYGGKYEESVWSSFNGRGINIPGIPNYSSDQLKTMLKKCATKEEEKISCPLDDAMLSAIFDGKSNTQTIVAQQGEDAFAAYAATQFYVSDKNGTFGQGNWYLPAIGELMETDGLDTSKMTAGDGHSGALHHNLSESHQRINVALIALMGKGVEAGTFGGTCYVSSSEGDKLHYWSFGGYGDRKFSYKHDTCFVRLFQLLENCFDATSVSMPQIGDVMYEDKTWGSTDDYDGSKTPVGIIVAVSTASGSVKIINLKNLTFTFHNLIRDYTYSFDPDNPYGGDARSASWTSMENRFDIDNLGNISSDDIYNAYQYCPEYKW